MGKASGLYVSGFVGISGGNPRSSRRTWRNRHDRGTQKVMIYIVGSGPSGVAAAVALVKRGLRPTILDAGVEADLSVTTLKARLSSVEPEDWTSEDLA